MDAGASFKLFIGQPTSKKGNEIKTTVDIGTAAFFHYDKSTFTLSYAADVTTNED